MRVECPKYSKVFNFPDERLPIGEKIAFPCPVCKGIIHLDLTSGSTWQSNGVSEKNHQDRPTGEALKKCILRRVQDPPPMPQTVIKARDIMADPKSDFKDLADLFEEFMADGNQTFLKGEKEILKLDHSEIASEVCKTWNIPQSLTIAIRYHHHPSKSHDNRFAYIIHVADAIAMMAGPV